MHQQFLTVVSSLAQQEFEAAKQDIERTNRRRMSRKKSNPFQRFNRALNFLKKTFQIGYKTSYIWVL